MKTNEKRIDNYIFRLDNILGSGSYSVVYKGIHIFDRKVVAIKVINKRLIKNQRAHQNILKQIRILRQISHPNIIKFHSVFQTINNIYIVMEHCNQGNLFQISKKQSMSQQKIWDLIYSLTDALKYLVFKNIMHRDLKPENILMSNGKPKIIDFGFACYLKYGLDTVLVESMGTPYYMSPQLMLGQAYTPKSDIWSFGIIIYELLYEQVPWPSQSKKQLIENTLKLPLKLKKGPSIEIIQLIIGCLKINQKDRINFYQLFQQVKKRHTNNSNKPLVSVKSTLMVNKQPLKLKISSLSTIHIKSNNTFKFLNNFKQSFPQINQKPILPTIAVCNRRWNSREEKASQESTQPVSSQRSFQNPAATNKRHILTSQKKTFGLKILTPIKGM